MVCYSFTPDSVFSWPSVMVETLEMAKHEWYISSQLLLKPSYYFLNNFYIRSLLFYFCRLAKWSQFYRNKSQLMQILCLCTSLCIQISKETYNLTLCPHHKASPPFASVITCTLFFLWSDAHLPTLLFVIISRRASFNYNWKIPYPGHRIYSQVLEIKRL